MKRLFDLILALLLLTLLMPMMVLVACAIWITSGRPIFFWQDRPGLHGKVFRLVKFRTMMESEGENLPESERITPVGRWLRKTSLDELPEFWNILKGEMSFVGPRPLLVEYLPLYTAEQAKRHEVLPGLTGLAQISGRNAAPWDKRLELDTWYAANRTFWLDVKILVISVLKVITGEGVSKRDHTSVERFRGSGS